MKIVFGASSGGHLEQLMMLKPLMQKYDSILLTENTDYGVKIDDVKTYYVSQINRKEFLFPLKIIANAFKSLYIIIREKPDVMITTGVLAMIPCALLMKALGRRLIYIESFAKVTSPTETGKLMYKFADRFYVQWEQMLDIYPNAVFLGGIY